MLRSVLHSAKLSSYPIFWHKHFLKYHKKPEKCISTRDFVTCTEHRLESNQEPRLRTEDTTDKISVTPT